ncbi:MAG: hypothetical protein R2800_09965 [Flavipsychrobacter sp.]
MSREEKLVKVAYALQKRYGMSCRIDGYSIYATKNYLNITKGGAKTFFDLIDGFDVLFERSGSNFKMTLTNYD